MNPREEAITFTKNAIKEAITGDFTIIQLAAHLAELDKILSGLLKRKADWVALYAPQALEQRISVDEAMSKNTWGRTPDEDEKAGLKALEALQEHIEAYKEEQQARLEVLMRKHLPNVTELAGALIGARLLDQAKSLKELSLMPASTVQVLGAEKALFRHMRSGNKPPKYGILFAHPYVQAAEDRGKAARTLADKLSIAAKIDYFKGEFKGDELKEQL